MSRQVVHHYIYFFFLFILAGSQAVSNWMMSASEIFLALNWIIEWNFREKISRARRSPLLTAWLVFFLVYIVWTIPGTDYHSGFSDLFTKLPLLAIPLIVLTSKPLSRRQFVFLVVFYLATVFVATIIGHVRYQTISDLPYRQIIPYISHIRFSLNVSLCIAILFYVLCRTISHPPRKHLVLSLIMLILLIFHFLYFLLLLRSYTGIGVLLLTAFFILLFYSYRIGNRFLRCTLPVLYCVAMVVVFVVAFTLVRDYYKPVELMEGPLQSLTAAGNPYQHKNDGLIENGNLVNNYVCPEELERHWGEYSDMPIYACTPNGYTVYPTLLRYLNALGTTKDSAGLTLLTSEDVLAIEKGIANPVYLHGSLLRKMAYVMLYEYESSKSLGSVAGFSLLQRIHLWRCGWQIFTGHPILGVGTCNVHRFTDRQLASQGSPLANQELNLHNQYLTFLVTFGLLGTFIIAFFFIRAIIRQRLLSHPLNAATLIIVLLSFLTENTLSTLAGCVFAVFFFTLMSIEEGRNVKTKE